MVRFDTYNASAHLVRQLEESGIADVVHDGADNLLIQLISGELVSIHLIETVIPLYEIRMTLQDNADTGLYTLFILWGDMFLPSENQHYAPDPWMQSLIALYGSKIYAFETFGKDIRIYPVYFEADRDTYFARYGRDVDVTQLVCATIKIEGLLRGNWLVADFVGKKPNAQAHHHTRGHARPAPPLERSAWDILGVAAGADRDTIKAAYRQLARLFHPDVNRAPDATEQMQRLNVAYAAALRETGFED